MIHLLLLRATFVRLHTASSSSSCCKKKRICSTSERRSNWHVLIGRIRFSRSSDKHYSCSSYLY